MTSWDTSVFISIFLTHEDIQKAMQISVAAARNEDTPVLRLVQDARSQGYDTVCVPLTTEDWKKRWSEMCLLPSNASEGDKERNPSIEKQTEVWRSKPSYMRNEVTITRLGQLSFHPNVLGLLIFQFGAWFTPTEEAERLTVMVSDWLELDAADDWVRHDAEIALQQELSYASYLGVSTAILPSPRNREHVASYARVVNACLEKTPFLQLSIRLPIYNPSALQSAVTRSDSASSIASGPRLVISESAKERSSTGPEQELESTWEMWDVIRTVCDYSTRLSLALDLTPALPTTLGVLKKWMAESVRFIYLPASTFIANAKGYPHRPTFILVGANAGLHSRGGELAYSQYIRHLEATSPVVQASQKEGTVENFAQGYQDYLQAPLQPLMDNLHSATYQTFERDPVKYRHYEEAIYRALVEWPAQERIVLCVAGAGRGPLISRALNAVTRARRDAFVYAIEKNPNAFVTLQTRQKSEWGTKIKLIFGDMRFLEIPEPIDILISELLGSFGDNELSPECLDGAMRFLKPNGISIPSSYTAHLAPLSSSKLYNEARAGKDEKSLETPYVVMFQAVNVLSGDGGGVQGRCGPQIQACWEFEHPRKDVVLDSRGLPLTNSHNVRSANLLFHIPHAGVLHGLAGYFEAVLYGSIGLSIHPHRKDQVSKDMLSWFPLFFPFKDPLYLPSNSELRVSIWRLTDERKVWYEWHAESFLIVSPAPLGGPDLPITSPISASVSSSSWYSPSRGAPSPLIDPVDSPYGDRSSFSSSTNRRDSVESMSSITAFRVVKIGQTRLHNRGGRSSWIGL
ncbi:hypothetical protein AX16_002330 [Volvariella volvacea WC 439]|nr:hypothetical protein AX16_002330 [Volvariella volvacea WC 439]